MVELHERANDLARALAKAGLTLQASKCSHSRNFFCEAGSLHIDGEEVPRSKNDVFKVLGVQISANALEDEELDFRVSQAWKSFWGLKGILMHRNAPLHQKFRLMDKAIRPNLLWAAEARRPTVVGLRRVRTVFRQMARLVQPMHRR
eukprot:13563316-Alexandrium_andersonii.AAC.1